jgi:23S rRNA pseudouridine1911/1915/1917 synthase
VPSQEIKTYRINEPLIRLDKFLSRELPALSRSYIQKLINLGNVLVNGQNAKASLKITTGDTVIVTIPPPSENILIPESIPLSITYEDADLIVVDKPAGMTVYPAPGHRGQTLINALLAYYPPLAKIGSPNRPGIVHRLDKDTSGLLVVAKNDAAQQNLIGQFKARSITKVYLALVKGSVTSPHGIIEAPIGRDPYNRQRMAIVENGKEARTEYRVKEYNGNYTLLEVVLHTGRTHQIRVHLSAIGYPVIGDSTYGGKAAILKRQFLHAHKLGFKMPSTETYREFESALPADLQQTLNSIREQSQ